MMNLGNVAASSTIHIPWSSFDSAGASVTTTGFADADIEIYKDGSVTQRASDAGVTATTDFDSATGCHVITIDLSDNTDASFYASGSEYLVMVNAVTIDTQTVRFWVARFVIGPIDAQVTGIDAGAITATSMASDCITSTQLGITAVSEISSGILETNVTTHTTANTVGKYINDLLADTAEIGTAGAGLTALATATALSTAQTDLDTLTGSDGVTLATSQPNYAPSTAASLATAQTDLDTLTGTDGATLATSQPNYAPATTASVAALNDLSAADVLTSALTEAYPTDGGTITVASGLYAIMQLLGEKAIAGTTLTVKKVDGSTTAMTFTLDDATTPTSVTRSG